MIALAVVPLAVLATWLAVRRPAEQPARTEGTQTLAPIATAERFDPTATSDVVDVPPAAIAPEGEDEAAPAAGEATVDPRADEAPPVRPSPAAPPRATPEPAAPRVLSDAEVVLLKAGPDVIGPKLLDVLEPPYPKPDRKEVVVVVSAFVSHTGEVLTATVKSGPSFKRRYREAAVAAVERAAFEPATQNGVPGRMWIDVEVRFRP